jgi:hypothetical protein
MACHHHELGGAEEEPDGAGAFPREELEHHLAIAVEPPPSPTSRSRMATPSRGGEEREDWMGTEAEEHAGDPMPTDKRGYNVSMELRRWTWSRGVPRAAPYLPSRATRVIPTSSHSRGEARRPAPLSSTARPWCSSSPSSNGGSNAP